MKVKLSQLQLPERDLRAAIDEDALDELAASMRDHGQLQPIGVREIADGRFEVVFGARRTRAARLLDWQEIEASLVTDTTDTNTAAKKLIENVQRQDLTPIEEAYGLQDLIGDEIPNIRKLQLQTGKSRDWIRSRLELAAMPEDLQGAVQAGVLSIGVARAFAGITNPQVLEHYIKMAVENGCTAEQAVIWASQAQFAETGIMTMEQIQQTGLDIKAPPQAVDQQYHCFICAELHSWRRVNTLVICASCQDSIGNARTPREEHRPPYPLDDVLLDV